MAPPAWLLAEPPLRESRLSRAVFSGSSEANVIRLTGHGQRGSSPRGRSLRWSDPQRARQPLADQPVTRWEHRGSPLRSADVRSASNPASASAASPPPANVSSTDPFDDPFGDLQPARQRGATEPAEPPETGSGADPWDDVFQDEQAERRAAPAAAPPPPPAAEDSYITPQSLPAQAPSPDAAPVPDPGLLGDDQPRDDSELRQELRRRPRRNPALAPYNYRDCDQERGECTQLAMTSMRDISLDVSPRITPSIVEGSNPQQEAEEMSQQLAKAPPRVWRNRDGEELAEGRLVNLTRGQVHIEQSDGRVTQIPMYDLGDEEFCFVSAWWKVPLDCRLEMAQRTPRSWLPMTMTWTASGLNNKPLYFQEVQLERYGHSAGPIAQPLLSGAHFFGSIAALPYAAGIHPPWECQYDLGYYRPGSCAPWLRPPLPISLRGGLLQAGVVTGGVALIP